MRRTVCALVLVAAFALSSACAAPPPPAPPAPAGPTPAEMVRPPTRSISGSWTRSAKVMSMP